MRLVTCWASHALWALVLHIKTMRNNKTSCAMEAQQATVAAVLAHATAVIAVRASMRLQILSSSFTIVVPIIALCYRLPTPSPPSSLLRQGIQQSVVWPEAIDPCIMSSWMWLRVGPRACHWNCSKVPLSAFRCAVIYTDGACVGNAPCPAHDVVARTLPACIVGCSSPLRAWRGNWQRRGPACVCNCRVALRN